MKMKNKKGFTLIELLAVIVILAIIALIATPLTISVINGAKEKSFINSVYGLIDGVRLLSAEQLFDNASNEVVVNFNGGVSDNTNFQVSGEMPSSGTMHLNSDGKVELKVWNEELGKCAEKGADESEVKLTEITKDDCKIEIILPRTFQEVMEPLIGTEVMNNDPDGNLRYVGPTPNNYVSFNGELWRIIGVFDGQAKIIRNDYYSTEIVWDKGSSDGGTHGDDGWNDWSQSTLQIELNNENDGYITTIQANDPTSYSYIDLEHVWNIGGYDNSYRTVGTRSAFYSSERGRTVYSGRPTTWIGAIGLIYPSDYGYSSSGASETCNSTVMYNWQEGEDAIAFKECTKKSWLYDTNNYQWALTPRSDSSYFAFIVSKHGYVYVSYVDGSQAVRPVLFLKSNTKIVGGLGTDQEPFILTQ